MDAFISLFHKESLAELVAIWWLVRGTEFHILTPVWHFISYNLGWRQSSRLGAAATDTDAAVKRSWKGLISFHRPSHGHLDLLMTEWVSDATGGQWICRHRRATLQTPPGSKNTVCDVRDLGFVNTGWGIWEKRGDLRCVPQCGFMASHFVSHLINCTSLRIWMVIFFLSG